MITRKKLDTLVADYGVDAAIARLLKRHTGSEVRAAVRAWVASQPVSRDRTRLRRAVDRHFPLRMRVRGKPILVADKDRCAIVVRHIARHGDRIEAQEIFDIEGEPAIVLRKATT